MTLRADHVAGGIFVALGVMVLALSGDLPFGQLSMPGSGFLPRLIAIMLIVLGGALALRGSESDSFSTINWSDGKHAGLVIVIAAVAISLYTFLGFITTMVLMMAALLVVIERRNPLRAAIYSVSVVMATYAVFKFFLNAPMPAGPLGF